MHIGVLTVELAIGDAFCLKDKRRVLQGIRDRARRKFNVSVAEVDANETWNYSVLGVAVVANEKKYANEVLSKVLREIEEGRGATVEHAEIEFL